MRASNYCLAVKNWSLESFSSMSNCNCFLHSINEHSTLDSMTLPNCSRAFYLSCNLVSKWERRSTKSRRKASSSLLSSLKANSFRNIRSLHSWLSCQAGHLLKIILRLTLSEVDVTLSPALSCRPLLRSFVPPQPWKSFPLLS